MVATGRRVISRTRRRSEAFFYLGLRGLQDLDFHRLATQRALKLPDTSLCRTQLGRRHDGLAGTHRSLCSMLQQVLPSRQQRA